MHRLTLTQANAPIDGAFAKGAELGLNIGGNIDAILISLPPEVKWS